MIVGTTADGVQGAGVSAVAVLYGPIGSACVQSMHKTLAAAAHRWDGADGMCLACT